MHTEDTAIRSILYESKTIVVLFSSRKNYALQYDMSEFQSFLENVKYRVVTRFGDLRTLLVKFECQAETLPVLLGIHELYSSASEVNA